MFVASNRAQPQDMLQPLNLSLAPHKHHLLEAEFQAQFLGPEYMKDRFQGPSYCSPVRKRA